MPPANAFLALTATVILVSACAKPEPQAQGPRPVVVESPQPADRIGSEAYPGTVRARLEADLSFRIAGKLATRKVDLGTRVTRGQVLATLDRNDARLNLENARAAVAAAEADLWLAQEEERRYQDLKERGHVGQSAVDQRVNTRKLSQARLEQAQAQSNLAQNQSTYTALVADVDGVVTEVLAEPGNVLAAGQPVVRVAADGEREVRISVPEGQIEALRAAEQLLVLLYTDRDRRWAGRLRDINPQADRNTRTHEARVTIVDADATVPLGASATVALGNVGNGKTFRLPPTAVGTVDKSPSVWVLSPGEGSVMKVSPRPVQVIQYLNDAVIVSGELSLEDQLVSAGVHLLKPDMAVQAIVRGQKAAL